MIPEHETITSPKMVYFNIGADGVKSMSVVRDPIFPPFDHQSHSSILIISTFLNIEQIKTEINISVSLT